LAGKREKREEVFQNKHQWSLVGWISVLPEKEKCKKKEGSSSQLRLERGAETAEARKVRITIGGRAAKKIET